MLAERVPVFSFQNALTGPMRRAAALQDDADRLALWAGQGAPLARAIGAGELVARLVDERERVLEHLAAGAPLQGRRQPPSRA